MQQFGVVRLVILCPVLSGSWKVQGNLSLTCRTSIETMEEYIYVLLRISSGTTPRTVQLMFTVS